jgi:hypothetical protein
MPPTISLARPRFSLRATVAPAKGVPVASMMRPVTGLGGASWAWAGVTEISVTAAPISTALRNSSTDIERWVLFDRCRTLE